MYKLDITSFKEQGSDLVQAIVDAVKSTQLWVIRPYPDVLLMTHEQFDSLKPDEDLSPEASMQWRVIDRGTLLCVMDVHVKGVFEPQSNVLLLN